MLWRYAGLFVLLAVPVLTGAVESPQAPADAGALQSDARFQAESQEPLPSVRELLATLADQQKALNYEGIFTYQNNASIESFQLQHWVDGELEYQRLYYLNGPEREAVVQQHTDCQAPGDQLILGRLASLQAHLTDLDKLYAIQVRGFERVAGRLATVLQVAPRDTHRFGYFFSVDRETGLLLKSLLLDENQRVIEQFQFVELNTTPDISQFVARPAAEISHQLDGDDMAGCHTESASVPAAWLLGWVPEGFAFAGERQVRDDVTMLMYTDGLSTFSVFVDPIVGQLVIEGRAQRGATNFYMAGLTTPAGAYQLTVVGEIPVAVAERVAQGLRPVGESINEPRS